MKKVIIAFSALMMIAGGTFGVLKYMKIGPFAEVNVKVAEQVVDETPIFIDMEPLIVPIFQGDKVAATIQMEIKIETMGTDKEAKIIKLMPRIKDAFLSDLYAFIPRLIKKKGQLDVLIIKQRLQFIVNKVAGPEVVDNILIQSVSDVPGG